METKAQAALRKLRERQESLAVVREYYDLNFPQEANQVGESQFLTWLVRHDISTVMEGLDETVRWYNHRLQKYEETGDERLLKDRSQLLAYASGTMKKIDERALAAYEKAEAEGK